MNLPLALGFARGLHMAGCFTLFGTILLIVFFAPAGGPRVLRPALNRLAWVSLFAAFAAGFVWFLLQSADMASASNPAELFQALPVVAESTRFGFLLLLRGAFLVSAMICLQTRLPGGAALISGLAVVSQAWLDHGGAMTGPAGFLLLIAALFHLGCGAAWIGSLPGLFTMIAGLPLPQAAALARRYSPFGIACVVGLIASAAVQFFVLIGSLAALFTTLYGRVVLLKILLLTGLVLLAALNRYRLAAALTDSDRPGSKRNLLSSIGFEIVLGLGAILAAGWLLNLTPPAMAAMLAGQS